MTDVAPGAHARVRPELTGWKKVLLAFAGAFLVLGGVLRAMGGGDVTALEHEVAADVAAPEPGHDPATGGQEEGGAPASSALVDGGGAPGDVGVPEVGDGVQAQPGAAGWSPFFLRGGFSFFVAFCVGYATRVWLRMAAFCLGTFSLGLLALSYAGAIDVDWMTLEGWWKASAARIEAEAVDFKTFLTGSLPQAGLAGLGLVAGFRRR